ncbi:MAG: hypothetical protein N2422_08930 [Rhodobacteraceae bacterium]|nr:hypothetical protein [Paracoccaceae bacterium]
MTALDEYRRLECQGVWRAEAGAQRRDVLVTLGEATIVILDARSAAALSHWSLPAVRRVNPGADPARFTPGDDSGEELEIDDPHMTAALGKVGALIEARRPHPGRLRFALLSAVLALVLGAGLFWVPGAIVTQTARALPDAGRQEIGDGILADMFRVTGSACAAPEGRAALDRLRLRLDPDGSTVPVVLATGLRGARTIPGGYVLLGRELFEDEPTPEAAAGFLVAESVAAAARDPLLSFLDWAGVGAAFRLLTTGMLPAERYGGYAEAVLSRPPYPPPAAETARAFATAGISPEAWLRRADLPAGAAAQIAAAYAALGPAPARAIMSDSDWVALQGICGG